MIWMILINFFQYTTLPSDNLLQFRPKIRDEKVQYYINRKAAKIYISIVISKIPKYEYLTVEEILPSNQSQMIEQAKFTYSALGKALKYQKKKKKKTINANQWEEKQQLKSMKNN